MLFIDEIHRLAPAIEEILYPAMEDFELDIVIGQGPGARSVKVPIERFTLVGATTRAGLLTSPLRARFGIVHRLDFYTTADIEEIVRRSARILGVEMADAAARRSPAARAARRASPTACCGACATTRRCAPTAASRRRSRSAAMELLEVDEHGFDEVDRRLLLTIIDKFGGGPGRARAASPPRSAKEPDAIEDMSRAVSDSARISRAHAARPRGDAARLRIFRAAPCPEGDCFESAEIKSLATYVPPRVLTNADLEKLVETTDEWIMQRTGIRERHIVDPGVGDVATWRRKPRSRRSSAPASRPTTST